MSPQAIVNPEEMDSFTDELKQYCADLSEKTDRLQYKFDQLGDTWRDQEHQKFAQIFDETMKAIDRFLKESDEHIPFLIRKAQKARDYLEQR
jgi:uncharacterized protein YukE